MLVFGEGGKAENPGKNPQSEGENQQQTQSTYDAGPENQTRDTLVVGERSHHCATPALKITPTSYRNALKWMYFSTFTLIKLVKK